YERSGFSGVLRYVMKLHRGQPIHGLHGSDPGGMWVRNIFDTSGWLYPCPVVRTGHISATAIRQGAVGLTSATVEEFLAARRSGNDFIFPSGYVFRNCCGFSSERRNGRVPSYGDQGEGWHTEADDYFGMGSPCGAFDAVGRLILPYT